MLPRADPESRIPMNELVVEIGMQDNYCLVIFRGRVE